MLRIKDRNQGRKLRAERSAFDEFMHTTLTALMAGRLELSVKCYFFECQTKETVCILVRIKAE